MLTRILALATAHVLAFSPGVAPREVQLWDVGDNPTDYGVHRWTERSAQAVMGQYQARGNPLQIDVEHNAAAKPDDAAPPEAPPVTGGYARLEIRAGAPWLVFDWSAFAVEQIETRQRLFLSPEYDVDTQTGEIVSLIRVSLVGNPGTHHARMLASAKRVRAGGQPMNLAMLLAALKAANAMEDPEAAKAAMANLIAELEKAAGGEAGGAPSDQQAAAPPAGGDAPKDPPAPGADDEEAKKRAAAAAPPDPTKCAAKTPASAPTTTPVAAAAAPAPQSAEVIQLAQRAAQNEARIAELEAENRFALSAHRIPESMHGFARTLAKSKEPFEQFLAGMPKGFVPATQGVRAAARPPQGDATNHVTALGRPDGELPVEDRKHMDRIFGINNRPSESLQVLPDGRVRATHMARPKPQMPPAAAGKGGAA